MGGQRPPGAITLVNRASTALYSGMLPGLVAGVYALEECSIDLRRLCAAVDVTLVIAEISGLELADRQLLLADRPPLSWDWLSLDLGATTRSLDGCRLGVKPLEPFLHWLQQRPEEAQPLRIRGGGAAAVELALALRGRQPDQALELLLRGDQLHLQPAAARPLGERLLRQAGVAVRRRVAADRPAELACTGSRAPTWLAGAGLLCAGDGRVRTTASLQVEGQPRIFAVGDCGVLGAAPRPPSGVWAVRAAPTLAANLARCLRPGNRPSGCGHGVPSAGPCSCWPTSAAAKHRRPLPCGGPWPWGRAGCCGAGNSTSTAASWPASSRPVPWPAGRPRPGVNRWPAGAARPSWPQPPWRRACARRGWGGRPRTPPCWASLRAARCCCRAWTAFLPWWTTPG
ncbi:MAG: hypothetical protein ACKOZN_11235 [Cyanobium sp.]